MYVSRLGCLATLIASAFCVGLKGKIVGFPEQLDELYVKQGISIVNGNNYPGKFKVELYKYNGEVDRKLSNVISALVNKNYEFQFPDLSLGQYELIVNSYDFDLVKNRYTINVEAEHDSQEYTILAAEHSPISTNKTTSVVVSNESPLEIQIVQLKQFYQLSSNSLLDMVMNSPLGFIFRSKLYTFMFAIVIGMFIAPYLASYISPEFVEHYKEIQQEIQQEKAPKLKLANQEEIDSGLKARTSNNNGLRKRK
jgi:hypothetical protein